MKIFSVLFLSILIPFKSAFCYDEMTLDQLFGFSDGWHIYSGFQNGGFQASDPSMGPFFFTNFINDALKLRVHKSSETGVFYLKMHNKDSLGLFPPEYKSMVENLFKCLGEKKEDGLYRISISQMTSEDGPYYRSFANGSKCSDSYIQRTLREANMQQFRKFLQGAYDGMQASPSCSNKQRLPASVSTLTLNCPEGASCCEGEKTVPVENNTQDASRDSRGSAK
ncbi:MAG: hypothetical protein COV57_03155 [Candidatus Liptonbacteria bacterium CG11_big_fil_rev_8_21_14_0_20_35_14]|uniref:Uncharacterized protein n=1 Tax=Candidatus Liptonbacteria bacterium CG11_big_fil_rev_8_21_14_0_20_35_14 TaxID=1974634 RepID=A0A2H0N719_9BACT|nr:MAG: hypothetical protein COV57_03155 [Candidatus Liptonbacteria bacterium CG11_big_fil_rev_8_21_14_0_20_35_14]